MQKHSSGLTLVSVSFDKSMKDVERALKRSVRQNPALTKLKSLGVTTANGNVRQSTLQALRKAGVAIDKAAEDTVLAAIAAMGVDFEKLALVERDPFAAAFGKNAKLYLVPETQRDSFYQAVGGSSPPVIFVIDRKGKLRFAGYPFEDSVTKLVESLLAEKPAG